MPELIVKGVKGLNLANSEEMFIGIVNLTENAEVVNGTTQVSVTSWTRGRGRRANVPLSQRCAFIILEISLNNEGNLPLVLAEWRTGVRLVYLLEKR